MLQRTSRVVLAAALLAAAPLAAQNVLLYDSNSNDSTAEAVLDAMLQAGDIESLTVAGSDDFGGLLATGGWNLVVMDLPSDTPTDSSWYVGMARAIDDGACAIQTAWLDEDALALAPAFEVAIGAEHNAIPFYVWNADPLFSSPQSVPSPMAVAGDEWGTNGFYLDPVGSAYAAGGFVAAPAAGQAAIVVGNGGRTIFNGFLFDDFSPANADADAYDDIQELIENEVRQTLAAGCAASRGTLTQAIPTLGEWGLLASALALGAAGFVALRRRRAAA